MSSVEIVSQPGPGADQSAAAREYRLRLESFKKRATDLASTDRLFSRIRVITFIAMIAVATVCVGDRDVSLWWILVPAAIFVLWLRLHAPIVRRLQKSVAAREFYISSLCRLAGDWKSTGETGEEFAESGHAWASDLDVFGNGSLFQRINLCRTLPGRRKLAAWLTTVASVDEIELRQTQTESLREQLDLREALAIVDGDVDWSKAESTITRWLSDPVKPFPTWALWGSRILGLLSFVTLVMVFGMGLRGSAILLMMVLQAPFIYANRRRIKVVMDHVDAVDKPLRQLADVTRVCEEFPFRDKSLQMLQQRLTADGEIASERIAALSRQIQWLNNSLRNQFFLPLAWMLGLFIHLPHRIQRWRVCYGDRINDWIDAVSTLEVLNSIAAFNYEQAGYTIPSMQDSEVELVAESLGHPLIDSEECVCNPVSLTTQQPLLLISGSNMSGKSTYLRAVGVNLVLAACGARVHAKQFRAFPFQLATAMRISDSLQEGRSYFYSVVQRLKSVVDFTSQERPVLFLLDEILSGTNSHDRRRGAEAVIRNLVSAGGLGIVTTHDLSLTEIVDTMDGKAANKHFEDHVRDGQMSFDYQLRDGVVRKSNAIELMRMMGLDV